MSCQNKSAPAFAGQAMVDQRPKFDKMVYSRKMKINRPTKKRPKPRFL